MLTPGPSPALTGTSLVLRGGASQATFTGSFAAARAITIADADGTLATREWCQTSLLCIKRLTANEDRAATTTLAAVTGLNLVLPAGNYHFRYFGDIAQTSTGGFKFDLTFSGTATVMAHFNMHDVEAGTGAAILIRRISSFSSSISVGTSTTTAFRMMMEGVINVTAAGTLSLRFAQNTAAGTGTLRANSTVILSPIP